MRSVYYVPLPTGEKEQESRGRRPDLLGVRPGYVAQETFHVHKSGVCRRGRDDYSANRQVF